MRPLPGVPDVVSQKSDTESKGYPLFRFGTGREGVYRSLHPEGVRRRSAYGKQENKHTAIYPGLGCPKGKSPTPACLDRYHHGGELQDELLARDPEGWRLEVEDEQILP